MTTKTITTVRFTDTAKTFANAKIARKFVRANGLTVKNAVFTAADNTYTFTVAMPTAAAAPAKSAAAYGLADLFIAPTLPTDVIAQSKALPTAAPAKSKKAQPAAKKPAAKKTVQPSAQNKADAKILAARAIRQIAARRMSE